MALLEVPDRDGQPDLSRLSAAGIEALNAPYTFEAELRRVGTRPVSRATGVPTMTIQRWRWHHSDVFERSLIRLFGDDWISHR